MRPERIRAYLYNNPPLEGAIMENMHGYKWQMKNLPHIDVIGEEIENNIGMVEVKVLSFDGKEIYSNEKEIHIVNAKFSSEFDLNKPLINPAIVRIRLKIKEKTIVHEESIRIHKIYGRVTDFEGNPMPAYIWAIPEREMKNAVKKGFDGTVVKADKNGEYELWLPEEKISSIFIDDESYHKETYECWIWDVRLRKDIMINPHIDKVEIYNLHAWKSYLDYDSLHIHFIPDSFIKAMNKTTFKLEKRNTKVYVNEEECEIKTFSEHKSWREGIQPSYILDIESGKFQEENTVIKVQIEVKSEVKGKTTIEKGEAYFLGFY